MRGAVYGVDGGHVVVGALVRVVMVEVLMLQRGKGEVSLHARPARHAVLVHVDDLDGARGHVVVLLVVLLPHLVEDDQHDGRHQRDRHEAADDDLGGLHDLVQAVERALSAQLRDGDGVGLLRGSGGVRAPRGGGGGGGGGGGDGGGGERLPRAGRRGSHVLLHSGEALVVRGLDGLHRHRGEVAEAAVFGRRHVERGGRRRVARRVAHHACVRARVLHGNVGEVQSPVVENRNADLVRAVRHDGAVGRNPTDGGQGAGPTLQLRGAALGHIQVRGALHNNRSITMKVVLVQFPDVAPLVAGRGATASAAAGVGRHHLFQPPAQPEDITVTIPWVVMQVHPLQVMQGREQVMGQKRQVVVGQVELH